MKEVMIKLTEFEKLFLIDINDETKITGDVNVMWAGPPYTYIVDSRE